MIVQSGNAISCLPNIKLRNFISIIFVDQIVYSRTMYAGDIFCFGKQRTGNNISCHRRKIPADGTNTIGLSIVINDFKFFY